MGMTGIVLDELVELDSLWVLTVNPRPLCCVHDCSREAVWNLFWEITCPNHPINPTPYCNVHKEIVEARMPQVTNGFKCGMCGIRGVYTFVGQLIKIERINT